MPISDNVSRRMAQGSWVRRMFEEANALRQRVGPENVFDLSLGNPVVEPPPEFRHELQRLVQHPSAGMHRYMENAGYQETRAAVATQLSLETGIDFASDDIVMTCGAAGALNVVLKTLLNQGDEVIVFAPYFMEYDNYVDNHGGVSRVVPTDEQFMPRLDALDESITERTKAVIMNSPNNPTGAVYSESMVHQLGELLGTKEMRYGTRIYLISDEAYRKIIYDGLRYPPVFAHHTQSIVVASHSKDLALPGERIGYIAVHPQSAGHSELMKGFVFCNRVLGFVNAPALMQRVVCGLQAVSVSVEDYQRKRDLLYGELTGMGYSVIKPQGAFYMYPRSPLEDDVAFVTQLREWNVLTVPGRGFGVPGYFRVSYCVEPRTIDGALSGFRRAAQRLGFGA